jgi:hypothetical protein
MLDLNLGTFLERQLDRISRDNNDNNNSLEVDNIVT